MKSGLIRDFRTAGRVLRATFESRGRSRRYDAAIYLCILWACATSVLLIATIVNLAMGTASLPELPQSLDWLFQFVFFAPLVAWAVRRAHDAGGSALYCLPLFAMIAARWIDLPDLVQSVNSGLIAIQIVILFIATPEEGPNRYGPNPRDTAKAAPTA